ncbi:hypothetical protein CNMCM5793_003927 [Aspergillus hiratsukae]|uniref:Uncharacterized protein n=1 Tax=Aspergillus hiratsukae TaxID=1194566 RepID=A0A8H6QBA8_9EURO|nr:hypothetical protein CNMCM5793_003927 [Aspergillus hiratsukae]KAF7169232.1 hypothetical protein CNMCM6106_004181 [Aspergillus hiratsukae]
MLEQWCVVKGLWDKANRPEMELPITLSKHRASLFVFFEIVFGEFSVAKHVYQPPSRGCLTADPPLLKNINDPSNGMMLLADLGLASYWVKVLYHQAMTYQYGLVVSRASAAQAADVQGKAAVPVLRARIAGTSFDWLVITICPAFCKVGQAMLLRTLLLTLVNRTHHSPDYRISAATQMEILALIDQLKRRIHKANAIAIMREIHDCILSWIVQQARRWEGNGDTIVQEADLLYPYVDTGRGIGGDWHYGGSPFANFDAICLLFADFADSLYSVQIPESKQHQVRTTLRTRPGSSTRDARHAGDFDWSTGSRVAFGPGLLRLTAVSRTSFLRHVGRMGGRVRISHRPACFFCGLFSGDNPIPVVSLRQTKGNTQKDPSRPPSELSLSGHGVIACRHFRVMMIQFSIYFRASICILKLFFNSVTFSRKGNLLASAPYDHTIKIWNTATGVCVPFLRAVPHQRAYPSLLYRQDIWTASLPVPERPAVHDPLPAVRPLLVDHPLQGTAARPLLLDVQSSPSAAESPFDLTSTTDAFHRLSFADLLPARTRQYRQSVWIMRNVWSAPTAVLLCVNNHRNQLSSPRLTASPLRAPTKRKPDHRATPPPAGTPRAQWDAPPLTTGDATIWESMLEQPYTSSKASHESQIAQKTTAVAGGEFDIAKDMSTSVSVESSSVDNVSPAKTRDNTRNGLRTRQIPSAEFFELAAPFTKDEPTRAADLKMKMKRLSTYKDRKLLLFARNLALNSSANPKSRKHVAFWLNARWIEYTSEDAQNTRKREEAEESVENIQVIGVTKQNLSDATKQLIQVTKRRNTPADFHFKEVELVMQARWSTNSQRANPLLEHQPVICHGELSRMGCVCYWQTVQPGLAASVHPPTASSGSGGKRPDRRDGEESGVA